MTYVAQKPKTAFRRLPTTVGHKRVLLVEDDPVQAKLMKRWLSDAGFQVYTADREQAALMFADELGVDVLICDQHLPDGKGLNIAQAAKRNRPGTSVLMVTGEPSLPLAVDALRSGIDDLLLKPFNRDYFLDRIEVAVEQNRGKATKTVLAIGAHPDDVEIGCGGALIKHREAGDRVIVLTLTAGETGGEPVTRAKESAYAARQMQAELVMADLPDTSVPEGPETIRWIEEAVEKFNPDIAYVHTINDNHQDHRAVHLASVVGLRSVPTVYCYQSPSTNIDFRPTRFVDIEKTMDGKLLALQAFQTQSHRDYLDEEFVRSTCRYWGRFAGYRVVEPFEVVRESGG